MKFPAVSRRMYVLMAISALLCMGMLYASWWNKERWGGQQFFGEVRVVTKNRLGISDPTRRELSFYTTDTTRFVYTEAPSAPPVLGDLIMLIPTKDIRGEQIVSFVRLFDKEFLDEIKRPSDI